MYRELLSKVNDVVGLMKGEVKNTTKIRKLMLLGVVEVWLPADLGIYLSKVFV